MEAHAALNEFALIRLLSGPTRNPELETRNLTQARPPIEANVAHRDDNIERGAEVLAPNERNAPNERKSCPRKGFTGSSMFSLE